MDVMIPMGSSDGATMLRESMSERRRITAPRSFDVGMRPLCFAPMIRRAKCGDMSPTNPMMPQKDTTTAVKADAIAKSSMRATFASKPLDMAVLSSKSSISKTDALAISTKEERTTTAASIAALGQDEPLRLPIVQ